MIFEKVEVFLIMRYKPHQAVWDSKIKDGKMTLTVHLPKGSYKTKIDNGADMATVMLTIVDKERKCKGKYLPGTPMKPCYKFDGVRLMEGEIGTGRIFTRKSQLSEMVGSQRTDQQFMKRGRRWRWASCK